MNLALFGGTFDPVHSGHLAAARSAVDSFHLDQILFVPANVPPHKPSGQLTLFAHRYAMVALACDGEPRFVPSLLESPEASSGQPNFAINTVRRVMASLTASDRLFYLIGADAFLDIPQWYKWQELLDACDFIVASRPGFAIEKIEQILPQELRIGPAATDCIPLRRTKIHLLASVHSDVSSSAIRRMAAAGEPLSGLIPLAVENYIRKAKLYGPE